MEKTSRRLLSVDALRAVAALIVLLAHIPHHEAGGAINGRFLLALPLDYGFVGVQLFLVISGFCIHLRCAAAAAEGRSNLGVNWLAFWKRRFFRLYPPYLAAIGLSLAVYYCVRPNLPPTQQITNWPFDVVTHLLMVHNLFPAYSAGLGNFPFWTLGLEEQLYALYAVFLWLRFRMSLLRTAWIVAVTALVFGAAARVLDAQGVGVGQPPMELGGFTSWPLGYWFNWVLGAVAAEVFVRRAAPSVWQVSLWWTVPLFGLGFVLNEKCFGRLAASHYVTALGEETGVRMRGLAAGCDLASQLCFALAFFVVLNTWVRAEKAGRFNGWWVQPLAALGSISYSLYLIHLPVLTICETYLPFGDSVGGVALAYALYTPLCLMAAWLFFVLVESHFLNPPTRDGAASSRSDVSAPAAAGVQVLTPPLSLASESLLGQELRWPGVGQTTVSTPEPPPGGP